MEPKGSLQHSQQPATCPYPEPDQSSPCPHPTTWRFILILPQHRPGSPMWSLSLTSPHRNPVSTFPLPEMCYMPRLSHSSRFDHPNNIWWAVQIIKGGTRWRSWLRHCATSRKVVDSIPNGVTGIFHWYNPSGRNMALGLTQPLTEMRTRNISWG